MTDAPDLDLPAHLKWHAGPIPLGPFQLESVVGIGGTAEVWRARHSQSGRDVAIKVVTTPAAKDPDFAAVFRREFGLAAQLNHPNVVTLLDYGLIMGATEQLSHGRLVADSPYIAFEFGAGGDLVSAWTDRRANWETTLTLLNQLLKALGHAHARGILHRDVKPDNLLWFPETGLWKLTDFGLSRALHEAGEPDAAGTPEYMAPEQFACDGWAYGPWTDLYGVGCLAYALVTGSTPFPGHDFQALWALHRDAPRPEVTPLFAVPEGFASWVHRLMAPAPRDRFDTAADARRALEDVAEGRPIRERTSFPSTPPTPERGVAPVVARPDVFDGRSVALVGRERERTVLWDALREVYTERKVNFVLLTGPEGIGKSRLATWLGEAAGESGLATSLWVPGGDGGSTNQLGTAIAEFMRIQRRQRSSCVNLARSWLLARRPAKRSEWEMLAEVVSLPSRSSLGMRAHRTMSVDERFGAIADLLTTAAGSRVAYLVLDDVVDDAQQAHFARWLLTHRPDAPILIVASCRHGSTLGTLPIAPATVAVGPLPSDAMRQLIDSLLGLGADVREELVSAAEGNPKFAVRLVGDWIAQGSLEFRDGAYHLQQSKDVAIPDSIYRVCRHRMASLTEGASEDDKLGLEIAAALGSEVDALGWRVTCALAGVEPSGDLIEALVDQGMARWTADGWDFADGLIRATLQRRSRDLGRWDRICRACGAFWRQELERGKGRGCAERAGRFLVEGGDDAQAPKLLLEAALDRGWFGEYQISERLLRLREGSMGRAGVPAEDEQWGAGWLLQARIAGWQGRYDAAAEYAERAEQGAQAHEWSAILPAAGLERGRVLAKQGRLPEAVGLYRVAIDNFERLGDTTAAAHARTDIGYVLSLLGEFDEAVETLGKATAVFEAAEDEAGTVGAVTTMAGIHLAQGRLDEADQCFSRGLAYYEQEGDQVGRLQCQNGMGEVARASGRHDEALTIYTDVLSEWEAMGSAWVNIGRINVALCLLTMGDYAAAETVLLVAEADLARKGQMDMLAGVYAELLPCLAARRDFEGWDQRFAAASEYFALTKVADADDAWPLQLGAALARAAGEVDRANAAFELARDLWQKLGNADAVAQIDDMLSHESADTTESPVQPR